jgi:hypothetical protein
MHAPSGRKLAPLGQGSGAVLLEDFAAVEVAVLVEVVVKRGMDGSELLKGLHVPELRHRLLSSSEGLMLRNSPYRLKPLYSDNAQQLTVEWLQFSGRRNGGTISTKLMSSREWQTIW